MWSVVDSVHAVLSTVLRWCLLPGIAVHELSHAAVCRLLGVEITAVELFDRSSQLTAPTLRAGFVDHEPVTSRWRSVLIALAPLLGNTLGAVGVFTLVRGVLGRGELAMLGPGQQALVVGGIWCGVALAFTGFPSEPDLRGFCQYLGRAAGLTEYSQSMAALVSHTQTLLAMAYALVLVFSGLFGPEQGLRLMLTEYVAYPAGLVLAFVWSIVRTESDWFSMPLTGVERRVDRLSRRVDAGARLDADAVRFLVEQLRNPAPIVYETAATTLVTVAARQPEMFGPHTADLFGRAEAATVPLVREALLTTLSNARDHVTDYERLAAVGVSALQADAARVRDAAPRLLLGVALDEPAVLDASLSDMRAALSGVSPAERGRLLAAMALVETRDVSPSTGASVVSNQDTADAAATDSEARLLAALPAERRDTASLLVETARSHPAARPHTVAGLRVLGDAYPAARGPIATILITYIADERADTRANVTTALRTFVEQSPRAVGPVRTALAAAVDDADPRVRRNVAGIVGELVGQYPDVIDTYGDDLLVLLADDDGEVRKTAAWALARVADTSPSAVQSRTGRLVAQLMDPHDDVRKHISDALASIADAAPESIAAHADVLRPHLRDPGPGVPAGIVTLLARLADSHPSAVGPASEAIVSLLETDDTVVQHNGLLLLGALSREDWSVEAGIDALVDRLDGAEQECQVAAAQALGALGPYTPTLLACRQPRLVGALDDTPQVRAALLETVGATVGLTDD